MRRLRFPLFPAALRWVGVAAVAAVIVYFSLITAPPATRPDPGPFWDKKLHFAAYLGLGLALAYATATSRDEPARRALLVFVGAVAFGVLVEVLQGPLPNRYFSYGDMLADAVGALLATGWFLVESRLDYVQLPR